jgi:hypothetical protein
VNKLQKVAYANFLDAYRLPQVLDRDVNERVRIVGTVSGEELGQVEARLVHVQG